MLHFGPGALAAAFAAGFVSFVSPCVLPLIPGYLSFVSGVGFDELGAQPRRVTRATALFVLGFGATFVAFGAGAAWFGSVLLENRRTLEIVAGIFIALAGLVYAGMPLPRLLLAERRHWSYRAVSAVWRRRRSPVWPSRSAGRRVWGRRWRRFSRWPRAKGIRRRALCYSRFTRSASGFRSCSSDCCSRVASASYARYAGIGASSASPRGRCSSPSVSCSRPASWCA
jgi:hypothetical protein